MTVPAITFSVEPDVAGSIVCLRIAPERAGAAPLAMMGLRIRIKNNEADAVVLSRIDVLFPGRPDLTAQIPRSQRIGASATETVYLAPSEAIRIEGQLPAVVRVRLSFNGFDEPKEIERPLRPHRSGVPAGSYAFPGRAADLETDEYFTHNRRHTGGEQFFGYDIGVQGWDPDQQEFTPFRPGADRDTNAGRRAWSTPVYAMADGAVITGRNDREDNPSPGTRVVQRRGDASTGSVSAMALARLSSERVASVRRSGRGRLQLDVWDLEDDGAEVIRRGQAGTDPVTDVAAEALTATRLATAARRPDGVLDVTVWSVSADGTHATPAASRTASAVLRLSLAALDRRRFVTAVATAEDALRVIVWEDAGAELSLTAHAFAGQVRDVAVVGLGSRQFVTAVRTEQNGLKLISWRVGADGRTLTRGASAAAGPVTDLACTRLSPETVATCARGASGRLDIRVWRIGRDDGGIEAVTTTTWEPVGTVAAAATFENSFVTAVTVDGTLRVLLWRYDTDDERIVLWGEGRAGHTDLVAVTAVGRHGAGVVTAVRTDAGALKLIAWHLGSGGGNSLRILHGDELVLYAHLRSGSVPDALTVPGRVVARGQRLGLLGNSGSSSAPHLHVHAQRVPAGTSPADLIAAMNGGDPPAMPFRPLPFGGARAMRLDEVVPEGQGQNPFTELDGHGLYFFKAAVRPD
ncbi:M23 family metallopeptidase [Blastococcus mobilis]|uniref:Peptidase family M23 n=1 Tax=Blastococcus mobilis TaxID=1938746 RepID=A0A238ZAV2_9ACTN|nr:M23 family metallopeptidase [Blastococcus mobilis]SNR80477.1 Peptidase family M23 [Blastococcus mobilis]